MNRLIIHWWAPGQEWRVTTLDGRLVASFPNLADAERYVIEHGEPQDAA